MQSSRMGPRQAVQGPEYLPVVALQNETALILLA